MKRLLLTTLSSIPLVLASVAYAQTTPAPMTDKPASEATGTMPATVPGTTATASTPPTPLTTGDASNTKQSVQGWSVKDKVMGKSVHNENDDKIGDVTDVVLTSDGQAVYFIIGAGGFLGMGQHDVAIPFQEIKFNGDKLTLNGYTKDQLKALPQAQLAK